MSVIVKMEMPTCCQDCPFYIDQLECTTCRVTWRSEGYRFDAQKKRMDDCPILCELPKKHGRLVDADGVESIIRKWFKEIELNPDILLDGVKSLPIIVSAERSEE